MNSADCTQKLNRRLKIARSREPTAVFRIIGYGIDYSGAKLHDGPRREGMEQPIYYWVPSIALSGMAFYTPDLVPAWKGNLFVGGWSVGPCTGWCSMESGWWRKRCC